MSEFKKDKSILASKAKAQRPNKKQNAIKHIGAQTGRHHHAVTHSHRVLKSAKEHLLNLAKITYVNSEQKEQPFNDLVISLRSTIRSMFSGDKPYHFYMSAFGTITAFGTTGTISQTITFTSDIQSSANWASLGGNIFDEFTYVRSTHMFCPYSAAFNVASPGPTLIAFDDDGPIALATTYNQLADYPSCTMMCPCVQGSVLTTESNSTGFHPYTREHKRPYALTPSPAISGASTTGWVDCNTPNNLLGAMLIFNNSVSATNNAAAYAYFIQYEVAFRCVR